jgi:phage shock protein A
MFAATINARQIYEEKYLSLRSRFLTQFEDAAEADDCLQELDRRFSNYMEYCHQESDVKLKKVFMIMAGQVSSEKLAEKKLQRENSLINRIKRQAAQALKEGVDFMQLALRLVGNIRELRLRQLSTASR